MITSYTKLGTMATEVKKTSLQNRLQCKSRLPESRERKNAVSVSGWGRWGSGLESLLWGSELSLGDATGGGCIVRGKHRRGSSILRIRHSTHEQDRMENWGRSYLSWKQKGLPCTGVFHEKLQQVFTRGPSAAH